MKENQIESLPNGDYATVKDTRVLLTPYFQAHEKPERIGVYPTLYIDSMEDMNDGFSYFDGQQWLGQFATAEEAAERGPTADCLQESVMWRGLTVDPAHLYPYDMPVFASTAGVSHEDPTTGQRELPLNDGAIEDDEL